MKKERRMVDGEIILVPYYPNYKTAIKWYQDAEVCKQVDNINEVYSLERLKAMYRYLSTRGDCYYIKYKNRLVGDITLHNGEISIVVCKEYQNKHIGRRCVKNLLYLAKEKGLTNVHATIYSFNEQSRKMFMRLGFRQVSEEEYVYDIK